MTPNEFKTDGGLHGDPPLEWLAPPDSALPLRLVIKVEATNGTTSLKAVEEISKLLRAFMFPKQGQIIETDYYRVTVMEAVDRLPDGTETL
jgi:hypothetical protein